MTTEGIGDGSFFSRFGSVLGMEVEENHRFVRNLGHHRETGTALDGFPTTLFLGSSEAYRSK